MLSLLFLQARHRARQNVVKLRYLALLTACLMMHFMPRPRARPRRDPSMYFRSRGGEAGTW